LNPRLFCRENHFPRVLALTYSFNPLFFERIIQGDLRCGGSTDITIVGDRNELQDAVQRYAGQFNYLGTRYYLTSAETHGAFHPKLLLRIGTKGAWVLLGSGNLTPGGWGGNRELAYTLKLDANQPGSASIVNHLLDHTAPYLTSEEGKNALERLRDYSWLTAPDEAAPNILMTTPDEPLAAQLQRRWAGRRFDRMLVLTGSTDEKGAFIGWCHERFGIEECVVAVSPGNASFVKEEIASCQAKVSLALFPDSQMLHAKFYWFDGPDGPAAIIGSANCSRAGWLLSPEQGGNVEIVQVYDRADANDFAAILSSIPSERVSIERTRQADPPAEDRVGPEYFAKNISLYRTQGFIDVALNRALPADTAAQLLCSDGIVIPLETTENGNLTGQVLETIPLPQCTCLAKVRIASPTTAFETHLHWIDDIDAITLAAQCKPPAEPFKNLPKSKNASEHDKVISDLALISASIFSESAAYRDPPKRRSDKQLDQVGQAAPIRPEDLVKSLKDLEGSKENFGLALGGGMHLSMNGVLRALFEGFETEPAPVTPEDPAVSEDPENQPALPEKPSLPPPRQEVGRELPADRHKQRLKGDLEKFFDRFASDQFSVECTASKLVQAAAYPLAVALLGERGGWLLPEETRSIVTRVIDILLNRNRVGRIERGLFEEVQNRYREIGQEDIFLQVVGDGTLWVVLLAVLAQLSWEKDFERFERAINLHRIYVCDAMRADTSVGKLTTLVTRLDVEKARDLIGREAPGIAVAIGAIEKLLKADKEALLREQLFQEHRVGDFIWHPEVGWGLVNGMSSSTTMDAYLHLRGETRKVAKKSFYLNLRMASEKSTELKNHLDAILFEQPRTVGVMGMLS